MVSNMMVHNVLSSQQISVLVFKEIDHLSAPPSTNCHGPSACIGWLRLSGPLSTTAISCLQCKLIWCLNIIHYTQLVSPRTALSVLSITKIGGWPARTHPPTHDNSQIHPLRTARSPLLGSSKKSRKVLCGCCDKMVCKYLVIVTVQITYLL